MWVIHLFHPILLLIWILVDANSYLWADVLLLQLESPREMVITAAKMARKFSVKVVLNPAPGQTLPEELLYLFDVLIPNENETNCWQVYAWPTSILSDTEIDKFLAEQTA